MRTCSLVRISKMVDADISSLRIDIEDFEFIPLHEYMSDNRKVSRKKHILNYRQEQLFVPEGHCSCVLWETTSIVEGQDEREKSVGIALFGGARHTEPSTWELGNALTILQCSVSKDDVEMKSCVVITAEKIRGSTLYPLQGSTMVNFLDKDNENPNNEEYLFLCGGVLTQKLLTALQNLLNSRYQKLGSQKGFELGESALMQAMKNLKKSFIQCRCNYFCWIRS